MSPRTLLHALLVAFVAVAILFFPEMRGRETRAAGEFDRTDPEFDAPPNFDDAFADAAVRAEGSRGSAVNEPPAAAFPGLLGRVIALDGTPVAGLELETLPHDSAESTSEAADDGSAATPMRALTRDDGSFELFSARSDEPLRVAGLDRALLFELRSLAADGSSHALLVVAPTSPVFGKVNAPGVGSLTFKSRHVLPKVVREAGHAGTHEFTRRIDVGSDGSFDFGRVPCSAECWLEAEAPAGAPQAAPRRMALGPAGGSDLVFAVDR